MRFALLFVAVLAAVGCKKDPPVEDPGDMGMGSGSGSGSGTGTGFETGMPADFARAVENYVAALEHVADLATSAGDCPAMAVALKEGSDAGKQATKEFDSFPPELIEQHSVDINNQFGTRIDAASSKLGEASDRCAEDPEVTDLMRAMGFE